MSKAVARRRRGFTLAELVVVIVIIGMVASMAIPRMSRGAMGANDAVLAGDINTVRTAILHYTVEHRNVFPEPDAASVVAQLTQYSDLSGTTSPTKTVTAVYGPYLHSIPPCPIGHNPGSNAILIDDANSPPKENATSTAGWLYNTKTGEFYPNATDQQILDAGGTTAKILGS